MVMASSPRPTFDYDDDDDGDDYHPSPSPLRGGGGAGMMDDTEILEVKDIIQRTLESQGLLNQMRVCQGNNHHHALLPLLITIIMTTPLSATGPASCSCICGIGSPSKGPRFN